MMVALPVCVVLTICRDVLPLCAVVVWCCGVVEVDLVMEVVDMAVSQTMLALAIVVTI